MHFRISILSFLSIVFLLLCNLIIEIKAPYFEPAFPVTPYGDGYYLDAIGRVVYYDNIYKFWKLMPSARDTSMSAAPPLMTTPLKKHATMPVPTAQAPKPLRRSTDTGGLRQDYPTTPVREEPRVLRRPKVPTRRRHPKSILPDLPKIVEGTKGDFYDVLQYNGDHYAYYYSWRNKETNDVYADSESIFYKFYDKDEGKMRSFDLPSDEVFKYVKPKYSEIYDSRTGTVVRLKQGYSIKPKLLWQVSDSRYKPVTLERLIRGYQADQAAELEKQRVEEAMKERERKRKEEEERAREAAEKWKKQQAEYEARLKAEKDRKLRDRLNRNPSQKPSSSTPYQGSSDSQRFDRNYFKKSSRTSSGTSGRYFKHRNKFDPTVGNVDEDAPLKTEEPEVMYPAEVEEADDMVPPLKHTERQSSSARRRGLQKKRSFIVEEIDDEPKEECFNPSDNLPLGAADTDSWFLLKGAATDKVTENIKAVVLADWKYIIDDSYKQKVTDVANAVFLKKLDAQTVAKSITTTAVTISNDRQMLYNFLLASAIEAVKKWTFTQSELQKIEQNRIICMYGVMYDSGAKVLTKASFGRATGSPSVKNNYKLMLVCYFE